MLEFNEKNHTYSLDGKTLPSVTQIIRWKLGNEYIGVSEEVLNKAAEYGNLIHSIIEQYEQGKGSEFTEILEKYKEVRPNIEVESIEQHITNGRIAGTYDMRLKNGCIVDIKTTSRFNREYLEYQIGLYNLILGQEKEGYCLYIPKRNKHAKWLKIEPKTNVICELLIEDYEKQKSQINGHI